MDTVMKVYVVTWLTGARGKEVPVAELVEAHSEAQALYIAGEWESCKGVDLKCRPATEGDILRAYAKKHGKPD